VLSERSDMKYYRLIVKYNPKAAIVNKEKGEIDISVDTDRLEHIRFEVWEPGGKRVSTRKYNILSVGKRGAITLF
jgi:hypothetical protein